jgi:hypothetical protein
VRDSHSNLRSSGEWGNSLDKTPEQAQIPGVRRQMLFRHEVRDLNASDEGEALRSMSFKGNR